jgi:hypothetical protein
MIPVQLGNLTRGEAQLPLKDSLEPMRSCSKVTEIRTQKREEKDCLTRIHVAAERCGSSTAA